jgi:hypothetical protein
MSGSTRGRPLVERRPDSVAVPGAVERAAAYVTAAWCLGFAAVSAWQLVAGGDAESAFPGYESGLTVMIALVLVLKLLGAVVALAAVAPPQRWLPTNLLASVLWGVFGVLGVYSAGNLVITVVTVSGLVEPSAAWTAAGGVTLKAVLYVLFFLVGAGVFGVLAVALHRRRRPPGWVVVVGLLGAPVVLALLLVVAPAVLGWLGLFPA